MSTKIHKCDRCGRRYRGQDDWNVTYRAGIVVGYRCPDDQTLDDKAEALINDATGKSVAHEVRPGDPGFHEAAGMHIQATAEGVFRDSMQRIAAGDDTAPADPYALADETLRRLAQTIGQPREGSGIRDDMADMFREMLDGLTGGDA